MKREELEAMGLTKEQIDKVLNAHHAELDPVQRELETVKADLKNAKETVESQETTIKGLKTDVDEFKEADLSGMKEKISNLEKELETKGKEYSQQMADRDFNDILRESIASVNGKNAKAITALLDVDTLKASKNQKEDIAAALKTLSEAEDSSMLFGKSEPNEIGKGTFPGSIGGGGSSDVLDSQMRAVMGLPPIAEQK